MHKIFLSQTFELNIDTAVFFQLFILKSKSETNISTRAYALVLILVPDFDFKINTVPAPLTAALVLQPPP